MWSDDTRSYDSHLYDSRTENVAELHKKGTAATLPKMPSIDDDLEIIEGIWPKVADILREEGIMSFSDLADMTPNKLHRILNRHGGIYASMDTETWPEQATLARDGEMVKLEKLKDKLNAGKRV
jgi:predicted flap endonuclease-1-like 5' DNA nuclease